MTRDDSGLVTLRVSDDGVGVAAGFDSRNQETLGLQTVVMIAEHQLQGTVAFDTTHGMSCEVRFTERAE